MMITEIETRRPMEAAWGVLVVTILVMTSSVSAELCGVDSTDPESMDCNSGYEGPTLFTSTAAARTPVVRGLSYTFYSKSCPNYNTIIRQVVSQHIQANPLQAAGIARIMFHDCFVQGCDASVLLTASGNEQQDTPNLTLRKESLQFVADIKAALEKACPNTVSCADILSLGAAEAIRQAQGPSIQVPVGRRDSNSFASTSVVNADLPSPFNNVSQNLHFFTALGLDYTDMVALSGAHTLGQAHCSVFSGRLSPPLDTNLDVNFASSLKQLCSANSNNVHAMDSTPTVFDNKYFKELLSGDVLLTSDAALELDGHTASLVKQYARSSSKFNAQFVKSFLKMSQLNVLTGKNGEIRKICSAAN